jgi:SAM-dependent methyltransferase
VKDHERLAWRFCKIACFYLDSRSIVKQMSELRPSTLKLGTNSKRGAPYALFLHIETVGADVKLQLCRTIAKFRSNNRIFSEIYRTSAWGGRIGEFYSGSGSYELPTEEYAALVREFIRGNEIDSVVDLGCGDFHVGSKFVNSGLRYVGVDVVRTLIDRNNKLFGTHNISFACLDIAKDDLPDGKLCVIRQVFQHLSNANIKAVLHKLQKYKFVLVTEHYPSDTELKIVNKDIPTGSDTRVRWKSGVYLDLPPFNVQNITPFHEFKSDWTANTLNEPTLIRTYLITQHAP